MGLISFIKDAGEKLFGHANAATPAATTTAAPAPPTARRSSRRWRLSG